MHWSKRIVLTLTILQTVCFFGVTVYFAGLNVVHLLEHRTHLYFHYDFGFFYWAFDVVWHHHSTSLLYNQALEQQLMGSLGYPIYGANQYVYPPQFAVLLSWLAMFPYPIASQVWLWLSLCCYFVSVYLLTRMSFPTQATLQWIFVIALCLANDGFYSDITIGNVTWLLFTLLSTGFYLKHVKRQSIIAGVLFGVAAVIKITPALLIVYYIFKREWKVAAGMFIGMLGATFVTATVLGWGILWNYVSTFSRLVNTSLKNGPAPYNLSMKGILLWLGEPNHFHWSQSLVEHIFVLAVIVIGALVFCMIVSGRLTDSRADMAVASMCMILVSPLVEGTHLLILVITTVMSFSIWWHRHMELEESLSTRQVLWFVVFSVATTLLSTIREILEGITHSFPLLAVGYFLLSIAALATVAVPTLRTHRPFRETYEEGLNQNV